MFTPSVQFILWCTYVIPWCFLAVCRSRLGILAVFLRTRLPAWLENYTLQKDWTGFMSTQLCWWVSRSWVLLFQDSEMTKWILSMLTIGLSKAFGHWLVQLAMKSGPKAMPLLHFMHPIVVSYFVFLPIFNWLYDSSLPYIQFTMIVLVLGSRFLGTAAL